MESLFQQAYKASILTNKRWCCRGAWTRAAASADSSSCTKSPQLHLYESKTCIYAFDADFTVISGIILHCNGFCNLQVGLIERMSVCLFLCIWAQKDQQDAMITDAVDKIGRSAQWKFTNNRCGWSARTACSESSVQACNVTQLSTQWESIHVGFLKCQAHQRFCKVAATLHIPA